MTAALELRGACVRDTDRVRLQPTSLVIEPGSVTGVIGRNGSGKSTLLAVLSSELAPTDGSVLIDGDDLRTLSLVERSRRRSILTQETTVTFPFSVREVVSWGRTPWRRTERARDDDAVINDAVRVQSLESVIGRAVTSLSGGERKRVHLARVLAQQTPVILLDEADSDLDLVGRRVIDDLVVEHARRGGTAVVVSHDVNRMARVCDRFIVMRDGSVHAFGTPDEVLVEETLTSAFGAPVAVDRQGGSVSVHLPEGA